MQHDIDALRDRLSHAGVTTRELDVFWLVGDRLRNSEIANALSVSERTVESHVSSLLRKLGATNRLSLVDAAAQLRNRATSVGNLPRALSSFVGRGNELDDLLDLVSLHRLVTITGPAGAGKTRLALQLARSASGLPPAVLIDLATVAPGADVMRVFADALGIAEQTSRGDLQLREALADGQHWLLVDNCEHVEASTSALLADLLAATADLKVLATSHGPLRVTGEVVYELPPLPLPPDVDDPSAVLGAASARLLADRAATAVPSFVVTADNARAVAAICRGLDGLPLAIELAAARIRTFSPAELVANMHDRLALLTDGAQGSSSRHRTLEAALRWSYDLLDEEERLLLERCSVFPGDFDYDTVVELLSYPPLSRVGLIRLFPRLLDRSLLSSRREGQATTYRMLDSIRYFAASRLEFRGERESLREHHARYHLRCGAAMVPDLQGGNQAAALLWFRHRWPDIRAGMRWALESDEIVSAWEFLAGVGTGWDILGIRGDLFDWLGVLLDRPLPPGSLGVRAAATAAFLLYYQDTELAVTYGRRAYDHAEHGQEHDFALALLTLGRTEGLNNGDTQAAIDHLHRAVAEFDRLGDGWHHALALEGLGAIESDPETALAFFLRSADEFGRLKDNVKRANSLNTMSNRSIELRAHLEDAQEWLSEARHLADLTGNRHEQLHAELFQVRLDRLRGVNEYDASQLDRLLVDFRRLGDRRCMSRVLLCLAVAAMQDGSHELARERLRYCIVLGNSTGDGREMTSGLRLLATSHHATGDSKYACTLLGAADQVASHIDPARRDALTGDQELRVALLAALGADAFESALAEGRDATLEQLGLVADQR